MDENAIEWPTGSLERAAYELVAYLRDVLPQQGTWGEAAVLDRGEALTISDLATDVEEALKKSVPPDIEPEYVEHLNRIKG